jgi:phosphate transport system permease protein
MKYNIRHILNKIFTVMTASSVVLMIVVLIAVLGPMIVRGASAVFFKSTLEFRRMQFDLHNRGDKAEIGNEIAQSKVHREFIYSKIDYFKKGIDTDEFTQRAKQIYREFGKELKYNGIKGDELSNRRRVARVIRRDLEKAFKSLDKAEILQIINNLEQYKDDERIVNTKAVEFFVLADEYKEIIKDFDLSRRPQYAQALEELEGLIRQLFGPRPDQSLPAMIMDRYGATRLDFANGLFDKIIWKEKWVQQNPDQPMVKIKVRRSEQFAGTELESIFPYLEEHFAKIVKPRFTFYWQYFIDDSTSGHYFGGVGPEILGTLILTVLAMVFVFPLGVISAAYLVECASDNLAVRIIRMCINTLAGVPSIVFGLFGLAFFVLFFIPLFGGPSKPNILAASLTLAVLTLPVMIRASEEAIRSVPQTYKEASLGLGASRFRTFVKVTLPAALPGILTGVILSLSRVAGETAPILFTGACAFGSIPKSLFAQTRTLSYGSYDIAVGDKIGMLVPHKQYGMVVTLVGLIICLNAIAIFFRARIFRRLKGH